MSRRVEDGKRVRPEIETFPTEDVRGGAAPLPLGSALLAEYVGTFVLVFFAVGAVNAAVATAAQAGLWQVAVVWAVGVSLGIYAAASMSGAHLNPAITVAAAIYEGFSWRRIVPYAIVQTAGAATASLVPTACSEAIIEFERKRGLLRGGPGSELSGPSPRAFPRDGRLPRHEFAVDTSEGRPYAASTRVFSHSRSRTSSRPSA